VAVAAVAAVVDEIAVIVAGEAEATVAGNRLPTIKICNVTGEFAEAGSPVLFSAILFVVKILVCSMLSLGNSYGYTICRKRPQRTL